MKNLKAQLIVLSVLTLTLAGCATAEKKEKLEEKVVTEQNISGRKELRSKVDQMIQSANDLTDDQKQKLTALFKQTRTDAGQMREESLKLRAVLIQDVLAEKYNRGEVNLIKQKLSSISKRQLALTYKTIDKVNEIMGRGKAKKHPEFMDETFDVHSATELN
ncbi:MAG: hypothetical protein ACXWQQ_07820 [Pseudobdellovibrio sp.]